MLTLELPCDFFYCQANLSTEAILILTAIIVTSFCIFILLVSYRRNSTYFESAFNGKNLLSSDRHCWHLLTAIIYLFSTVNLQENLRVLSPPTLKSNLKLFFSPGFLLFYQVVWTDFLIVLVTPDEFLILVIELEGLRPKNLSVSLCLFNFSRKKDQQKKFRCYRNVKYPVWQVDL